MLFIELTLKIMLAAALTTGLCLQSAAIQSDVSSAKEHFERARSYSAANDSRAEQEYRKAIAVRGGVYPEAWEWLGRHLAHGLRFDEAAAAWRIYLKQTSEKVPTTAVDQLKRLERAAQLKVQVNGDGALSIEEYVELIKLVDGFGSKEDAIPYAEKAVKLYPESAKALICLAELIKNPQSDRALELLNRAIAFEPNEPAVYVSRGSFFFWVRGNSGEAEADFRRAIELSRGLNASAWAGLGDALAQQGHRDEAIAAYRKYLSIRPKSAAHYDGEIRKSIRMLQSKSSAP